MVQGSPDSKLRHDCKVDMAAAPVARLPIVVTGTRTSFPPMLTCAKFMLPHDRHFAAEASDLSLHGFTNHKHSQWCKIDRAERPSHGGTTKLEFTIKGTFVQRTGVP